MPLPHFHAYIIEIIVCYTLQVEGLHFNNRTGILQTTSLDTHQRIIGSKVLIIITTSSENNHLQLCTTGETFRYNFPQGYSQYNSMLAMHLPSTEGDEGKDCQTKVEFPSHGDYFLRTSFKEI